MTQVRSGEQPQQRQIENANHVHTTEISVLRQHPNFDRLPFADADYAALKEDISHNGIIYPIVVCSLPDDATHLYVLDGEHRWQIAKELGHAHVPIQKRSVASLSDAERQRLSLNVHRRQVILSANQRYADRISELEAQNTVHDNNSHVTDKPRGRTGSQTTASRQVNKKADRASATVMSEVERIECAQSLREIMRTLDDVNEMLSHLDAQSIPRDIPERQRLIDGLMLNRAFIKEALSRFPV